ncbi:integrin alpha-E-like [Conger conger]|uniref:integrin alpha-E-like n=1 Tax=Conger conger TaxID=82655 RepID=UPI002A5A53DE|nr:integrin alpha-E-like [Conger conger]
MIHGYVLLAVICATAGFNIFTTPVRHFQEKGDNLFGQTIIESQLGVLVASPVQMVHCTMGQEKCTKVNTRANKKKGLKPIVSAAKKTDQHQHLVCQQVRKQKGINEELNGNCTLLQYLQKTEEIAPSSLVVEEMKGKNNNNNNNNNNRSHRDKLIKLDLDQRIHRQRRYTNSNNNNNNNNDNENEEDNENEDDAGTEIAFVLDGSGSIDPPDFQKAKDSIINTMKKVWETCFTCNFAIVQYGRDIRTELSLLENENGTKAIEKVKSIEQIMHYTKTASAINHVLEHVFVAENGSKEEARKIMIIITDGSIFLDQMNLTDVLNSPKMKNILRLAIGVGDVVNDTKAIPELKEIASDPDEDNLFMVDDYSGLDEKLSIFEKTITGIEGTQQGAGFQFELAEAGFSSHIAHDGNLLFGAVGAYDWSGGLILRNQNNGSVTFLNDSSTGPKFSYLGYSVTSALGPTETLYISGAPRYNLTGSVLVFDSKSHKLTQILRGEQVGSYFGAVLCVLDFNRDGKTDYLLVGAQYYHVNGEEGKVYVHKLNQGRFDTEPTEWRGADGHVFAMFGSAIVDIGDIDGNRFNDVAVGAPLEEDEVSGSSGSIYIYNGYEGGIRPRFSQRVSAVGMGVKLRFFGRSVSRMPASQGGEEYISVGSEGTVTVLRVLPVILFKPKMTVAPPSLPFMDTEKNKPVSLKICFNTMRGDIKVGKLRISYQLDLDAAQATKRLSFASGVPKTDVFGLTPVKECLNIDLKYMAGHDRFTPIKIKLNFSLINASAGHPLRILDKFSPTVFTTELPFQRDCKQCIAEVSLSESRLSTSMIVVGHTQNLNIAFNLTNKRDASPMTTLILTYPNILLYDKVQPADSLIACRGEDRHTEGERSRLNCHIMHPVLRSGAQVSFAISWQLVAKKTDLRTALILANLTGANNGGEVLDTKSYESVVKNALKVQLTGKPKPQLLIMNIEGKTEKEALTFRFEIYGENKYNASLFVNIRIVLLARHTELDITEIPKGKCHFLEGGLKTAQESYLIRCAVGELQDTIIIKATAFIRDVEGSSDMITANATLEFDGEQFRIVQEGSLSEQVQIKIIKPETKRSTGKIVGGSIGGFVLLAIIIAILVKCGFFRSRYAVDQVEGTD